MAAPVSLAPESRRSFASRAGRGLLVLLVVAGLLFAAYTWFALSWSYSVGERAGYVQKFSRKGVVSKTWEGELAMVSIPGTMPEKFFFTVRDAAVAARINATMGKKVAISYEQHVGVPTTFFGETGYFVSDVREVPEGFLVEPGHTGGNREEIRR